MQFKSGEDRGQQQLLPDCIEDYVEENHPVRVIDAFVESLDLKALGFTKYKPNETGRPMYAPKALLKLYVYGYMNRVRSSRRLEAETRRNLEVMWLLCRLMPDHKTIARFRQENAAALKGVFHAFVKLCVKLDLYGKELIAVDGSKFHAWNSKDSNFTAGKLNDRLQRIDEKIASYLQDMDKADADEGTNEQSKSAEEIREIIKHLHERRQQYKEYQDEIQTGDETQISLTDPDSRLMKTKDGMHVCLNVQTAVDSKHKLIAEFSVENQVQDKNLMGPTVEKAAEILKADCMVVLADAGYDSATDIAQLIRSGYAPQVAGANFDCCIPCEKACAEEITDYENGRSIYIRERNIMICPMGKPLYPSSYNRKKRVAKYYNGKVCRQCQHKCTTEQYKQAERLIRPSEFRKEYNASDLYVRKLRVRADKATLKQRKSIVEHPFGTVKRALGIDYLLLRGKAKASGEIALAFLAFNLKRAINILGPQLLIEALRA